MFKTASMTKQKLKGLMKSKFCSSHLLPPHPTVEMLQAAKLVKNQNLKIGFINHALDEYKHTNFFLNLLSQVKAIGSLILD